MIGSFDRLRTGATAAGSAALRLASALVLVAALVAPTAPVAAQSDGANDPPARVGRLSFITGTVSFHTIDEDQWEPAVVNYPVTEGTSFWTEPGARATLQLGHGVVRLDSSTEVYVEQFNDQTVLVNVPQGSVNFRLRKLDPGETYQINTPSGTVALTSPGRFHVDAGGNGAPGNVTVFAGTAELIGQTTGMTISSGQSMVVDANQPPLPPQRAVPQDIDTWSDQQESQVGQVPDYVSPEIPGVDDLAGQGNWDRAPDYGAVWYPPVQVGWAPYRYGHWGFVAPWGWTWIDDAPWGFAPFHYGRWLIIGGRWGWIPGAVVERPVYAPALVAFVGGGGLAVGIGVGPVVGWVPLGPREVYVPPYGGSIDYVRRVNVTNVTNVNNITINNINTVNNNTNVTRFVNASATTVVPTTAMAGSRHVATAAIAVPPAALAAAAVNTQPTVKPTTATVGASKNVVQAVGGNVNAAQGHAKSPGPAVQAKPLPTALIRPLTTTTTTGGAGGGAPGPAIVTPTTGAGTGLGGGNKPGGNASTNTSTGGPSNQNVIQGQPGGSKVTTTTTTGAGAGVGTGPGKGNLPPVPPGPGSNANTNANTSGPGAGAGNKNVIQGPPGGSKVTTTTTTGAGAGVGAGAGQGNQPPVPPGKNLSPAAGAGTGTGPGSNVNTNTNTNGNAGKGNQPPGPPNRTFSPTTGGGANTNTNANTNANVNKAIVPPGPGNAPNNGVNNQNFQNRNRTVTGPGGGAAGAGGGNTGQPAGGGQPSGGNKAVQTNVGKPPPPPPPQAGGNANANANAKPKCDPKVQKCPPP